MYDAERTLSLVSYQPLASCTRVIDLTTNMSGPLATMVLAEQGADVVKVEPIAGDLIRTIGTGRGGMSAYFANLNRGEAVDRHRPGHAGRARLVAPAQRDADVFVQNFRPGVVERLGRGRRRLMAPQRRLDLRVDQRIRDEGPAGRGPGVRPCRAGARRFLRVAADGVGARDGATGGDRQGHRLHRRAGRDRRLVGASHKRGRNRVDVSMLDVAIAFLWPDGMMNHTIVDPGSGPAAGQPELSVDADRGRPGITGDVDGDAVGQPRGGAEQRRSGARRPLGHGRADGHRSGSHAPGQGDDRNDDDRRGRCPFGRGRRARAVRSCLWRTCGRTNRLRRRGRCSPSITTSWVPSGRLDLRHSSTDRPRRRRRLLLGSVPTQMTC